MSYYQARFNNRVDSLITRSINNQSSIDISTAPKRNESISSVHLPAMTPAKNMENAKSDNMLASAQPNMESPSQKHEEYFRFAN